MGGTPLEDAVRHGHKVVEMLLRQHGGVCSDDPEGMAQARRHQEKLNAARQNASVDNVVDNTIAACVETKTLKRVEKFLEQLVEMDWVLETDMLSVTAELGELAAMEQDYNKKAHLKINEVAKRQITLESVHAKLHALADTVGQWTATLENIPLITPAVIHRMVKSALDDQGDHLARPVARLGMNHQSGKPGTQEFEAICLERVQLLSDIVSCLASMLDGDAGGEQTAAEAPPAEA
eukprot:scaffold511094_cov41-Prasinocladus_malaysianus.AAC.1